MKECIRCWNTEKDIRKNWFKICYVWFWSYKRHDYSPAKEFPKDWLLLKNKITWLQ